MIFEYNGISGDIVKRVLKKYHFFKDIVNICSYGNGHINKTYLITTTTQKYIFQQINTNVFKNPQHVMENIECITEYIKNKIELSENKVLEIVLSKKGKLLTKVKNNYYRCYKYIDGAKTYELIETPQMFKEVGIAIGRFQKHLQDFPTHKLNVTIPDFHNTLVRFKKFIDVVNDDKYDRVKNCLSEIEFIWDHKEIMGEIVLNDKVPVRVSHNDTKLNNIMISDETKQAICIIDLDTAMPGTLLYDFGDAIRVGANPALEDEKDLSLVTVDIELFMAFAEGFIQETYTILTEEEKKLLVTSAVIITLECGMRFLTDYLENDVYFNTKYDEHNLIRARTQLKFVKELEQKKDELETLVSDLLVRFSDY